MSWALRFRNNYIPNKLHYNFLSISISFLYFLSRSARNKGNINAIDTCVVLEDVINVHEFKGF